MQNHVISEKEEYMYIRSVLLRRNSWRASGYFCQDFDKKEWEGLTTYLVPEIRYFLQKLIFIELLKLFLPRIGLPHGLKMAAFSSRFAQATNAQDIAVLKRSRLRTSDTGICAFRPFLGSSTRSLPFSRIAAWNNFVWFASCMLWPFGGSITAWIFDSLNRWHIAGL